MARATYLSRPIVTISLFLPAGAAAGRWVVKTTVPPTASCNFDVFFFANCQWENNCADDRIACLSSICTAISCPFSFFISGPSSSLPSYSVTEIYDFWKRNFASIHGQSQARRRQWIIFCPEMMNLRKICVPFIFTTCTPSSCRIEITWCTLRFTTSLILMEKFSSLVLSFATERRNNLTPHNFFSFFLISTARDILFGRANNWGAEKRGRNEWKCPEASWKRRPIALAQCGLDMKSWLFPLLLEGSWSCPS